jgi:hypothetical protein
MANSQTHLRHFHVFIEARVLINEILKFQVVPCGGGPDFNGGSNEAYIFGGTKVPFGGESNSNGLYWIKIDAEGKLHIQVFRNHLLVKISIH